MYHGNEELIEEIRGLIQPVLAGYEAELIDLIYRHEGRRLVLRFLVDHPGGVTLEECSEMNRQIGRLLDERNLITEKYYLEVCSPGLDRPLVTQRDFERAHGELITILTCDDRKMTGRITVVGQASVTITTDRDNVREVRFGDIKKAKRVITIK